MSAGAALGGHVAARLDLAKVDTPAYVTDLGALEDNLKLLASVMERAGVTIILALKGFAWDTANGGKSPTDAEIATGSNWDKVATSWKHTAGVMVTGITTSS